MNRLLFLAIVMSQIVLGTGCGDKDEGELVTNPNPTALTCGIDVHQHLVPSGGFETSAAHLIEVMDELGIERSLILPPPGSGEDDAGSHYNYTHLATAIELYPDRLGLIGGGQILNPQIHALVLAQRLPTEAELDAFEADARTIAAAGVAGFGEMAALHLSFDETHPYIAIPLDHLLFLRLADVAGELDLPIDIHFELTTSEVALPEGFDALPEGRNPATLPENLSRLENLLAHNRDARIVWTHPGWDNIGHATTTQIRSLLAANSNLYLAIKILNAPGWRQVLENRPLDENGAIRPEWLALITDYPGRFLLGADEFTGPDDPQSTPGAPSTEGTWSLLGQLPDDLAEQIVCQNPRSVYRLD